MVAGSLGAEAPRDAVRAWIEGTALWSRAVAILAGEAVPTWLVGGSIRDALRHEPGVDLDIAVDGDATRLGRRLADALQGAYYTMDAHHDVGRIILDSDGSRFHIDLAGLRGSTILADLSARDLTVNAMGVALTAPLGELLDPTGGLVDLAQGIIRHAYPAAFSDDPLRMLRAIRFTAGLGFCLHPATREAIGAQHGLLEQVSAERVRDELFLMLELPSITGLELALGLGLLPDILGPGPVEGWRQGLGRLKALQAAIGVLDSRVWWQQQAWSERPVPERSRRELVSLAAVLSCTDCVSRRAVLTRLRLSGRESGHIDTALSAMDDILAGTRKSVDAVEAHRYYREYGAAGADGAALVLAMPEFSGLARETADTLLAVWLDQRDIVVSPVPLLTGPDLIGALSITPGPVVGRLLRGLAEAQAAGAVTGPDEAWAWARAALAQEPFIGKQVEG